MMLLESRVSVGMIVHKQGNIKPNSTYKNTFGIYKQFFTWLPGFHFCLMFPETQFWLACHTSQVDSWVWLDSWVLSWVQVHSLDSTHKFESRLWTLTWIVVTSSVSHELSWLMSLTQLASFELSLSPFTGLVGRVRVQTLNSYSNHCHTTDGADPISCPNDILKMCLL